VVVTRRCRGSGRGVSPRRVQVVVVVVLVVLFVRVGICVETTVGTLLCACPATPPPANNALCSVIQSQVFNVGHKTAPLNGTSIERVFHRCNISPVYPMHKNTKAFGIRKWNINWPGTVQGRVGENATSLQLWGAWRESVTKQST
jgi:hypothetical protein